VPAERLQKILARAGHGSRRSTEVLIAAGRVKVNGVQAALGSKADPALDVIEVDGKPISLATGDVTLVMYKPAGYVVTARDEQGRSTVYELLTDPPPNLRYVGRLDVSTSGALLLTTDGELAHRLTHPRYLVEKAYHAVVEGIVSEEDLQRLRDGVTLDDGPTAPAVVERLPGPEPPSRLRLVIHEGRNRQIRRMIEALGHRVISLHRPQFGPVTTDGLRAGDSRAVTPEELAALRQLVGLAD
jgi:23S rRNA pseudouridine2605 synthase